jgi:hypothetical protein
MLERTANVESIFGGMYNFKVTFCEKFNASRYCVVKEAYFVNYVDAIKASQEWMYNT